MGRVRRHRGSGWRVGRAASGVAPVGELRDAIESYVARAGYRRDDVYVMDGSKRSSKANALRRLVADNLGLTTAHPLYAALRVTHPAPVDRIRAIRAGTPLR